MKMLRLALRLIFPVCVLLGGLPLTAQPTLFYSFSDDGTAYVQTAYPYISGTVTIESNYDGVPVTAIGTNAIVDCGGLTGIVIPDSIISIGDYAFLSCPSLSSINLPASVINIGKYVFTYDGLESINVAPANPAFSSLGGVLFDKNKTDLVQYPIASVNTRYTAPGTITNIGDGAFWYAGKLTDVTLPNSVQHIGDNAFNTCSLTSITTPVGLISIGSNAFDGCNSMTDAPIPDGLESLGDYAFFQCGSLDHVHLPDGLTNIGSYAFALSGLTNVCIPAGVTSIGSNAFSECYELANITVAESNSNYSSSGGVLFNKEQTILMTFPTMSTVVNYSIPATVTNIADYAFYDCFRLTNINIPASVRSIGNYAFQGSSLTGITIPTNVASVGEYAFSGLNLTSLIIPASVTKIGSDAFDFCGNLTNITFLGNAPALDPFAAFYWVPATVYYYYGTTGWDTRYGYLPTAELFPAAQVGAGGVTSGGFTFTFSGVSNQTVVIEGSTNLLDWQPVWTNTFSNTSATFSDPQWKDYPSRFYRVR